MSEKQQPSKPVGPQESEKGGSPFKNMKPAEIPTKRHTFSYQGEDKKKKEQ